MVAKVGKKLHYVMVMSPLLTVTTVKMEFQIFAVYLEEYNPTQPLRVAKVRKRMHYLMEKFVSIDVTAVNVAFQPFAVCIEGYNPA